VEQRGKGEQGGPGLLQAFLRIPVPFYKKGLGRFQLYLLNEEVGAWLGRDSYVRLAVPLPEEAQASRSEPRRSVPPSPARKLPGVLSREEVTRPIDATLETHAHAGPKGHALGRLNAKL
jgi:hypothetical protein